MQTAQEARQSVLDQLELNDSNKTVNSTDFVDQAIKCMQSMLPKIETIRVGFGFKKLSKISRRVASSDFKNKNRLHKKISSLLFILEVFLEVSVDTCRTNVKNTSRGYSCPILLSGKCFL